MDSFRFTYPTTVIMLMNQASRNGFGLIVGNETPEEEQVSVEEMREMGILFRHKTGRSTSYTLSSKGTDMMLGVMLSSQVAYENPGI